MKKTIIFILVALFATGSLYADDISVQQALQIASQFAAKDPTAQSKMRKVAAVMPNPSLAYTVKSDVSDKDNVYVINYGNDMGFVVVSGETGTDAILGYCDHGAFDYKNCPPQMKEVLDFYSLSIDTLRKNPEFAAKRRVAQSWPSYIGNVIVEPLLTTQWNQWAPYNNLCPTDCPAGCVPTAVAQIMKYWRWPDVTCDKVAGEDFSGRTYDWDNMIDNYETTSYTAEQADAVAHLMADVGKALGTVYNPKGSGTATDFLPLFFNFKYNKGTPCYENLTEVMKAELNQSRPMLYSARPFGEGNGHELVVDGYTSNNYFHFNYGWGGSYDGFYITAPIYCVNPSIVTNIYPQDIDIQKVGDIKYVFYKNGTAAILGYYPEGIDEDDDVMSYVEKENGEIVIPSTVKYNGTTYKVTRIYQRAFYNKGHFTKVTLGDNIETIDHYAFIYSTIDELVLSDKMEVVPDEAFQLTDIQKLTIGASVKRIGKKAFYLCPLSEVICKSASFVVDEQAFGHVSGSIDSGEWLEHITKIGSKAFVGRTFTSNPSFAMLEEIGPLAFSSCTFPAETFVIPPKLKHIEPDAFSKGLVSFFKVENNPHFLCSPNYQEYLCNNNGTRVLMTVNRRRFLLDIPETVVKLEPRSIRSKDITTIPGHIVEMDGAFQDVTSMSFITCMAVVPPQISDDTFNDNIFQNDPTLYVPEGTAELYRNAPGWRKFERIIDEREYVPMQPQGLQYNMVVNTTHEDGSQRVNIPVNEITSMELSEDGQNVIIKRNGKEDLITPVAAVDSVAWVPGFMYEDAEIFDIDEDHLTVEAQKCKVRFDPTVIDGDVQLCVRNSVLKPDVMDGVVSGFAIDLSLSDGTHDLTGTVDITIPVTDTNKKYGAAYFNEETGEWEPVYYEYDKTEGAVTISTNHLSVYGFFELYDDLTSRGFIKPIQAPRELQPLGEAARKLLELVSSPDPEWEMRWQVRNDMGLWQSVGLDVLFNAANGTLETALGYKPFAEEIENAVNAMGYLATALNVVDVARAELRGDDIGVASGALKTILGHYSGVAGQLIGTPVFTASMATSAAIGIALEKFGTMVQQRKIDLYREAYRIYYSRGSEAVVAGTSKYGNKWYRTSKDWFELFYTAFNKPDITANRLDSYIETEVRDYCDRFWGDTDAQAMCVAEAKAQGLSSWFYPDENTRKTISDEFFAELMNGQLVSVIQSVRNHVKIDAFNQYTAEAKSLANLMNTKIGLRVRDKSCKESEKSKYADYSIRFTYIPRSLPDPENLQGTIDEQGRANIGYFTHYALIVHDIPTRLTLIDPKGKEVADYPFEITNKKGKQIIDIDLSTGGVEVENPNLDGLELIYEPNSVEYYSEDHPEKAIYPITRIYFDNSNNKKARFETEIEKFFCRHEFITVDELGNFKIGDDIVGKFEDNGLEGSGSFTLNTNYQFKEQNISDCIKVFNSPNWFSEHFEVFRPFNGTLEHKVKCEFTITRTSVDSKEYEITYTGEGTYSLQTEVLEYITGVVIADNLENSPTPNISAEDIHTTPITADGTFKLKYTTKLQ
ncbi:MAG: C10 family peptidase [Bacteroidaceae bacterium]|nr:C10 family peptidase [Bacteroidaceae bacterium]